MKRHLLISAMLLYYLTPIPESFAGACDKATGKTTGACTAAIEKASNNGAKLNTCLDELKHEYFGDNCSDWWNCDGAGPKFNTKKAECKRLADAVWNDLAKAYKPGGDTSPRKYLRKLRKVLSK